MKFLFIFSKNALALAKEGHVSSADVAAIKSGGKSINELTGKYVGMKQLQADFFIYYYMHGFWGRLQHSNSCLWISISIKIWVNVCM